MTIPVEVKIKAQDFQERIKGHVKRYNPDDFAVKIAVLIDEVFKNKKNLMPIYPLHFLIHAIEANCAYHRNYNYEELTNKRLNQLVNLYKAYNDPVSEFYIIGRREHSFLTSLFFIFMARQQFYLQLMDNKMALARSLVLFDATSFPKTTKNLEDMFCFGFKDWHTLIFCVLVAHLDSNPPIIQYSFVEKQLNGILSLNKANNIFKLLAVDVNEVKTNYQRIRETQMIIYDPYIRSIFEGKPLFRLSNNNYVIIHKALLMRRFTKGLFDICYEFFEKDFGREFGHAFEKYIGKLLIASNQTKIVNEKGMRKYTIEKICDYIIVTQNVIILIESKAVEYKSIISSENAVKQDGSTAKVSRAIDQLFSAIQIIKTGVLSDLIGDISSKVFFAITITFDEIYMVNSDDYWINAILPRVKNQNVHNWSDWFEFRPQVLDCSELENIIMIAKEENISIYDIIKEKLTQPYHIVGDWEPYLSNRIKKEYSVTFLENEYRRFTQHLKSLIKKRSINIVQ